MPLPRWSPGALTDGVNEAKLVLGLGVWKAGPRCMERVEVDEDVVVDPLEKLKLTVVKVRLRGEDKADKGPKLRTLPCLVPKGKRR